eukprot:sb/3474951/
MNEWNELQSDLDLPGPDLPEPRFTGKISFPRFFWKILEGITYRFVSNRLISGRILGCPINIGAQIRHGITYRFVSNRLISGRTCGKMHRFETRFGLVSPEDPGKSGSDFSRGNSSLKVAGRAKIMHVHFIN